MRRNSFGSKGEQAVLAGSRGKKGKEATPEIYTLEGTRVLRRAMSR